VLEDTALELTLLSEAEVMIGELLAVVDETDSELLPAGTSAQILK
jgi:hypothetical protein